MTETSAVERTAALAPPACARCGAPALGEFCSSCGAPVHAVRNLSVRHYVREAIASLVDIDSAVIASMRALFFKPGELTREYFHGSRFRYLPPFRVFLVCNIIYFLAASQLGINVLTTSFRGQVDDMVYHNVTSAVFRARYPALAAPTTRVSPRLARLRNNFEARYDAATEQLGKTILIVLVPFYALVFLMLYAGTKRYFAEHLVFATHTVGALLVAIVALGTAVSGWAMIAYFTLRVLPPDSEWLSASVLLVGICSYLYAAQRVVYRGGRAATVVRTAIFGLTIVPMIIAFKFVLFFATLWWIS